MDVFFFMCMCVMCMHVHMCVFTSVDDISVDDIAWVYVYMCVHAWSNVRLMYEFGFLFYFIQWGRVFQLNPVLADIISLASHLALFILCLHFPRQELEVGNHACTALTWVSKLIPSACASDTSTAKPWHPFHSQWDNNCPATLQGLFNISIKRKIVSHFKDINQTKYLHTNSILSGGMYNSLRILESCMSKIIRLEGQMNILRT